MKNFRNVLFSLILCLFIVCLIFIICGNISNDNKKENNKIVSSKYIELEIVEHKKDYDILVDNNTGVLYLWYRHSNEYGQNMTPIYNKNGSLKNIYDKK